MPLPEVPITPVPAATSPAITDTNLYPQVEQIVRGEVAAPEVTNRQPRQLLKRTDILRLRVNQLINVINVMTDNFLRREGAAVGSKMAGNLNMLNGASRSKVVNVADGEGGQDAATMNQLAAVRAMLTTLGNTIEGMVKADGSVPMSGNLDMNNNRVTGVADPLNLSDLINKNYADTLLGLIRDGHLARDGHLPMVGTLNMNNNPIVNLPVTGYPTAPHHAASKVFVDNLAASISSAPTGAIMPFIGPEAKCPAGWLIPVGQLLYVTDYPGLFNIIGFMFGGDNVSGQFRMPDLRGRVIAGIDNLGGIAAGRIPYTAAGQLGGVFGDAEVILNPDQIPPHTHGYTDQYFQQAGTGTNPGTAGIVATGEMATDSKITDPAGGGMGHNNVQPTIALTYIVKV